MVISHRGKIHYNGRRAVARGYTMTKPSLRGKSQMDLTHVCKANRNRKNGLFYTNIYVRSAFILWLAFGAMLAVNGHGKSKKLTPEEVVARHLNSIAPSELLASIQSRAVYGTAAVRMPLGTVPQILPVPGNYADPKNFFFVSSGNKTAMGMKLYNLDYQGEHFAFDGKAPIIGLRGTSNRSLLEEFINSHSGMVREGLLGGVLSTAWPLLKMQEGKLKLRYSEAKIADNKFHRLTYMAQNRRHLDRIEVSMFFEFETYRHVTTEYAFAVPAANLARRVIESFADFRTVDGLTLPVLYKIQVTIPYTSYDFEIRRVIHNGSIDAQFWQAPESGAAYSFPDF